MFGVYGVWGLGYMVRVEDRGLVFRVCGLVCRSLSKVYEGAEKVVWYVDKYKCGIGC